FVSTYARDFGINADYQGISNGKNYAWGFNSLHPGGAQFCLGDAKVAFFSENIDYQTFAYLNYIHDGQVAKAP
ncbi:MAG: DUF1559 domain-containing protein, partial [Planctomycetaceae bacterium]|nr:DUF1559 domain-containing protein [Planctomycetaceae bacterium]